MSLTIFEKILYFLMLPVVAIGAILSPLTNDVRIFYGVEYLDWKYIADFPSNINAFWEIKPIGNHIVNYFLVGVTNLFIPFENHFAQEILIKAIAVAIAIFACWLFSRNVLKIKYGFLLCFFGLACSLNLNTLQAEWWAIIFAMISCALFMGAKNHLHYIAGSLLIMVLLVKGTTGCLIVCAILTVLIFNKHIDWIRGGIGFVVTGLAFYAASLTIWPQMLSDIFMAPILSHVGEYSMVSQVGVIAIATAISMSIYIPVVGLGLIYGGVWIKNNFSDIRAKLLILVWFVPAVAMWLQSESFAYQFFPFVLPAIVGLVLYETETPIQRPNKKLKRENIVAVSIVALFVMYCTLYAPYVSYYGDQEKKMNDFFWNDASKITETLDIQNQSSILYLDTGSLPYYFGVNSTERYVAPLILQRNNPNRTVVATIPQYWTAYYGVMNYTGKYIVADGPLGTNDGWFGNDTPEKKNIINKINTEYFVAHTGAWNVYERNETTNI